MRIKFLAIALAFALAPQLAQAQSMGEVLFSEVEKRVITEFFGSSAQQSGTGSDIAKTAADAVKGVVDKVLGQDKKADDDQAAKKDDDDDDGGKGKKGKKDKKNKGKGKGKGKGRSQGLPPGLAKRDKLPPGLQRQLEKNGRLPKGLQTKSLPGQLDAKLPEAPEGTERVIADKDVMLVDKATGIILDVVKDVIKGATQ